MIHILLMILNITGVVLLVILGLIFTAVLLILFVPVRYRADVSFNGRPDGEAAVSWLLHLIRIQVSYHEHADVSGRVLWFKLFDVRLWSPEDEEEDDSESEPETVFTEPEKAPVLSKNDFEVRNTEVPVLTETENEQQETPLETVVEVSKAEEKKAAEDEKTNVQAESEEDELVVHATELIPKSNESSPNSVLSEDTLEKSSNDRFKESVEDEEGSEKANIRFSVKIKEKSAQLIKKVQTFWTWLRELPGKFQKLADGISKKKISLEKTWNSISMFWHDEQNQKAFCLIWKRTKKLVRYVLPRKLKGRIHFGFDDPYDTGRVLTAVSPFYGLYARTLTLEPDFTGTVLDGELHFKGRIALWYPLWTAARLFISKDFRRLLKFFRKRERNTKNI